MAALYPSYQFGSGLSDIGRIYRGPMFVQRGRGIGSIFGGLWKHIAPIAMSGLRTLGKQTLKTSAGMLEDLSSGKKLKNVLTEHGQQAAQDLARKGINKLRKIRKGQSGRGILSRTTLGTIKAGGLHRNMLVGHSKHTRKRVSPSKHGGCKKVSVKRKSPPRKRRSNRKNTTQTGGKRRRNQGKQRRIATKKRRKTTRSIDIFDI